MNRFFLMLAFVAMLGFGLGLTGCGGEEEATLPTTDELRDAAEDAADEAREAVEDAEDALDN